MHIEVQELIVVVVVQLQLRLPLLLVQRWTSLFQLFICASMFVVVLWFFDDLSAIEFLLEAAANEGIHVKVMRNLADHSLPKDRLILEFEQRLL